MKPLNELKIKEEIRINILPETEEQIIDDKLLIKNQLYEIKKKFNISAFFKDNVKNPEIGLMLMIIGDYKNRNDPWCDDFYLIILLQLKKENFH